MRRFSMVFLICFFSIGFCNEDIAFMGVGNSIMDLLTRVDQEFYDLHVPYKKGGSYKCTPEKFEALLAELGELEVMDPGGSCGNTVRAIHKLGMPCRFLSHAGNDVFGHHYKTKMDDLGIAGIQIDPEFPTIRLLCLVTPDAERTFLHCHEIFDWDVVEKSEFDGKKWVHFESFILWESPGFFEICLKAASEQGAVVSLDLSNFVLVQQYKPTLQKCIDQYVDVLFGNEDEVLELTGLNAKEGCLKLHEQCSMVIVTRGKKGCIIAHDGQLIEVPALTVEGLVDTTGAGDYFSAGFIYGCLNQYSVQKCAQIGHFMGREVIEVVGTNLADESWQRIHHFIAENSDADSPFSFRRRAE